MFSTAFFFFSFYNRFVSPLSLSLGAPCVMDVYGVRRKKILNRASYTVDENVISIDLPTTRPQQRREFWRKRNNVNIRTKNMSNNRSNNSGSNSRYSKGERTAWSKRQGNNNNNQKWRSEPKPISTPKRPAQQQKKTGTFMHSQETANTKTYTSFITQKK